MKGFFLIITIVLLGIGAPAQEKATSLTRDLTRGMIPGFKEQEPQKSADSLHKRKRLKIIQVPDTLTLSDFMMSVERVNDRLNDIRDSAQLSFETVRMGRKIDAIGEDLKLLRLSARERRSAVNIKNTYLYQNFASSLEEDNNRLRSRVNLLYGKAYRAKLHLKTAISDSIFQALSRERNIPELLGTKLVRLNRKWNRTDSIVKNSIDTLNVLQVGASDNAVNLSNMLNIMDKRLDRARPQLFGQEVSPLWKMNMTGPAQKDTTKSINILDGEKKAIGYYMDQTSDKKKFMLFLAALLFVWILTKKRLLNEVRGKYKEYEYLHLNYFHKFPWLTVVVLLLFLTPFFDAYAPNSYIIIEYTLLLIACSYILSKVEVNSYSSTYLLALSTPKFRNYWGGFFILFIVNSATYLLIEPTFFARIWMLALHVIVFGFALRFYRELPKEIPYHKWIKPAILFSLFLLGLGMLANLTGRFSLSGIMGFASILAITHVLILPVFIEIVIEFILLQLLSSRIKKGIETPFNTSVVIHKIKSPLIWISVLIWVVMLCSNLNIYHTISSSILTTLYQVRTIGSISFKLISVLLFFLIIWLAHVLQRLISYLFGETGSELEDQTNVSRGHHSRLLITRLLVLIAGYLLAIAVSGLPIDKLTFLLGALGVGIGMGLQNVVNNFVSGIILIFDGSLHIGDEIEVSQQAGRVKEIGLRASTLHTADGADIIIPNGTMLSQNIINYTSEQKRVTISFTLQGKELDTNIVNEVINSTLKKIPNVIGKRNPAILYTKVTPENLSITVRFWCTSINTDQIKSEAMLNLSSGFSAKNIGFE